MPQQKPWIPNIPKILKAVQESDFQNFTRSEIQKIFEIRKSAAVELMHVVGTGRRVEGELRVSRSNLLFYLQHGPEAVAFAAEEERRLKLAVKLDEAAKHQKARKVVLPVERSERFRKLDELEHVCIANGELRIVFSDAEDLATQLWKLSQVMAFDWMEFQRRCDFGREAARVVSARVSPDVAEEVA